MSGVCRVFGLSLDEDEDDREPDQSSADDGDDEVLITDNADNPTNLFSSATGQPRLHLSLALLVYESLC